jgi:hypothetical protein
MNSRRNFLRTTFGAACAAALARAASAPAAASAAVPVLDPADAIAKKIRFRPGHYLELPARESSAVRAQLLLEVAAHPGVRGTESRFTWRALEKTRDNYDFSGVDAMFARAEKLGKPALLFLGDKSFSKDGVDAPDYIATDFDGIVRLDPASKSKPILRGGGGSMPRRWDPRVNERYLKLVAEIGRRYDSHPLFESLLFQETHSVHFLVGPDYTTEKHLAAIRDRLLAARAALPHAQVCQYTNANFDDHTKGPAPLIAPTLREIRGMLGAPDILPFQPYQAKDLHPHYQTFNGVIPLSAAMQTDSFRHTEPQGEGKPPRPVPMGEMVDFALDRLHLNHVIWNFVAHGANGVTSNFPDHALPAITKRQAAFDHAWKFSW